MTTELPAGVTVADLPDWDEPPPRGGPVSTLTEAIRRQAASRRSVLKLIAGGAMGLGIATIDLIPTRAAAVTPILSVWGDCHGYIDTSSVCVPRTAYYSSTVCNGSWHRNDSYHDSFVSYSYTFNNTSCSGRNAWKWFGATGAGHTTTRRKCSDGHTEYADIVGNRVSSFSICRTAI